MPLKFHGASRDIGTPVELSRRSSLESLGEATSTAKDSRRLALQAATAHAHQPSGERTRADA